MVKPAIVDSSVPRAKALLHSLFPLAAYLLGWPVAPYLLAATGAIMAASVLGGPRFSLFGRVLKALRPVLRIKPGKPEYVAPHRFAEAVGSIGLLCAAALYLVGLHGPAETITLTVVALAFVNFAAGICVGCQIYTLLRGSRKGAVA
ncbi:MAG: DUF4395 domain-containing protein [Actinomycetota bacterium]